MTTEKDKIYLVAVAYKDKKPEIFEFETKKSRLKFMEAIDESEIQFALSEIETGS